MYVISLKVLLLFKLFANMMQFICAFLYACDKIDIIVPTAKEEKTKFR